MDLFYKLSSNKFRFLYVSSFLILVLLFSNKSYAQEINSTVLSSAGKAITSADITLSYTVGESIATVKTNSNGTLIQGFEQPKLDTISVSVAENNLSYPIKIYPNPTIGPVNIEIETTQNIDWVVSIYNIQSKLMASYPIILGHNSISIHQLPTASYILIISNKNGTKLSSHIIEKIN